MGDIKKDFSKVITKIRADRTASLGKKVEYPKAMMTSQQMAKNTATVNCAGKEDIALLVLQDKRFLDFLAKYNASAWLENVTVYSSAGVQIRITYSEDVWEE